MLPGMPMNVGQIKMESSGTAWLAEGVPGHDVVKAFYNTFASEVQSGGPAEQMLGGLVRQMSALIDRGFPMQVNTQTQVTMIGAPLVGMGRHSDSVSRVTWIDVLPRSRAPEPVRDLCNHSIVPEGVEPLSLNEMMSEASPQMSQQEAAEMQQAMQEAQEAMQNMTPEQRAMLESMGMSMPGTGQAPAAGSAAVAASGSAARAGGSSSTSAALTTDNMVQSVQNHLEFLGYSAGNTTGELSTDTIIAISQFQAEMGVEVTGEVSPQLLGLLAAEVDAR
jgi:hypothetical protein